MFLYIALIYVLLLLIVVPLWLHIDINFKSMLLLEQGRNAELAAEDINDILSITSSSMWYLTTDDQVVFNKGFYEQYNIRNRPVRLKTILHCLAPDSCHLLEQIHLRDGKENIMGSEISGRLPGSPEWHTFSLNIYAAPASMPNMKKVGVITLIDDIKRAEMEQLEARRKEEDIMKKNNLFITMGEEIRTPLEYVIKYSKILCVKFNTLSLKERRNYGENIVKKTDKLLSFLEGEKENIISS